MTDEIIKRYGQRVGYTDAEMEKLYEGEHRIRHLHHLAKSAPLYTIEAEVVRSRNCNSGHVEGQKLFLDVDGNLLTKLCPKKMCVYLVSQLVVPVAQINERLSEGHDPDNFHFMRYVRCPDVGVECMGYGDVMLKVSVLPRVS